MTERLKTFARVVIRILVGYVVAVLITAVTAQVLFGSNFDSIMATTNPLSRIGGIAVLTSYFSIAPFVICAAIAEMISMRRWVYYAVFAVVPLVPVLFGRSFGRSIMQADPMTLSILVCQLVGATAYWWMAGRHAGSCKTERAAQTAL